MTHALTIQSLEKTYQGGFQALKGIDLVVEEGDFFALLGPNGAGKSTTIGIITQLVNITRGQVKVFGHDIVSHPVQAKALIGVVPQEFNFNQFEKVIEIVINQAGYYGISRGEAMDAAEYYLNQLNLWDKRNAISRMLSGGMKRRLMIARGLIHQPKMLILDEPTAGVDIELRHSTWEFLQNINQQGTTIILTTHYLEEAEHLCRGIAIIDHGQIIENTTVKELLDTLNHQTLILELVEPIRQLPSIQNCEIKQIDESSLELIYPKQTSLNDIYAALSQQQCIVASMRNKSNRLEQLFINLIRSNKLQSAS